ncbi:MAG: hypothetical protein JSV04_01335 [Candidatus Heimdallarchaeota archaeon]|nr:MAG: hypothetical protein JSV04_01335 [Candidatus Heimdallarchaeota archaeon]
MQIATKVLEDNSTLLQIQKHPNALRAPKIQLVSLFAIQPKKDIIDAAKSLHLVTRQSGVQLIRQIFPAPLKSTKRDQRETSYTALMILVRVYYKFQLRSEKLLPNVLREAWKEFVRRRSMTHSILKASGCKVTLVERKQLIDAHIHGMKVAEGITIFKGVKGFHSKIIEPFLCLKQVPSRHIQEYSVPDLSVRHRVGTRMDNPEHPVGFPALKTGRLVICGSNNKEVISVMQQLITSLGETTKHIFVIDSHNELNGLINYIQQNPLRNLKQQVFRLGTNIHLNLCDVIVPPSPSGEIQEAKARAAWKAHLINQILLSSLHTSEYLTARYAVPLESQIRKTAETNHLFTLRDISLSLGGVNESNIQENMEGANMMFADLMTVEAIVGILEQFRSFPEVNYSSFKGHYSDIMVRDGTITFFQFGAQPPLIRRATVGFLLHYLSQTMQEGCVVLTHTGEFLTKQSVLRRDHEISTSSLMDACYTLATKNVLILGCHQLQSMAVNMNEFDEIKNVVYLKMSNRHDREIVINRHELEFKHQTKPYSYSKQQFLGIMEGEGLLFREDAPQNVGFHFKLDKGVPIDLNSIWIPETKQRGSATLGLTPAKYQILMKLLKLLVNQPSRADDVMTLIEPTKYGELSLGHFQSLGLFEIQVDGGTTYWIITPKGRDYYAKQHDFVNSLPVPLSNDEVGHVRKELERLESFYDISSSRTDRLETNSKVKLLVGRLLNYNRFLRATSIPWLRIAEYHDLVLIDSLEWQDFRNLFDLAHSLVNNLLLEIRQLQKQRTEEEIQHTLQVSSLPSIPRKDLDDFLPDDYFIRLQQLSKEIELETYPKTGIFDIYYTLYTNNRSLFDEIKSKGRKSSSKDSKK